MYEILNKVISENQNGKIGNKNIRLISTSVRISYKRDITSKMKYEILVTDSFNYKSILELFNYMFDRIIKRGIDLRKIKTMNIHLNLIEEKKKNNFHNVFYHSKWYSKSSKNQKARYFNW